MPWRKERLCPIGLGLGVLQPDSPGGSTEDGRALRRGQYCHDALRYVGWLATHQAYWRNVQPLGGQQLRQVQI